MTDRTIEGAKTSPRPVDMVSCPHRQTFCLKHNLSAIGCPANCLDYYTKEERNDLAETQSGLTALCNEGASPLEIVNPIASLLVTGCPEHDI